MSRFYLYPIKNKSKKIAPNETLTNIINNNIPIALQNYKAVRSNHNDFGHSPIYTSNLKSI